jgi:hypothetical protein
MTEGQADIYAETMQGLAAGLTVGHIATFDLHTCADSDDACRVLDDSNVEIYDQIPVRKNGRIVGVLERRGGTRSGAARDHMRTLENTLLVSAEGPLMSFVRAADASPYRLVVRETEVSGIVTRSDLLKLPVRVLAFAMITHLESLMAEAVRQAGGADDEQWMKYLNQGRREKIFEKQTKLKSGRIDLPLLELTDFCDKRDIVRELRHLDLEFERQLKSIEDIRNKLAHAGEYAADDEGVRLFVEHLKNTESWIEKLRS